jgi:tRNA(Met) cytidine acetyltransferase
MSITARPLTDLALELLQRARRHRHRRLLLLTGERESCRQQARQVMDALALNNSLWIGEGALPGITTLANAQALQCLGGELDLLIYDAFSGFDPDAFGALVGTLCGGGILVLLTPPLESWQRYADPEHARMAVAGYCADDVGGRFLQRLAKILQSDPTAVRFVDGGLVSDLAQDRLPIQPCHAPVDDCLTSDQQQAVEAIERVARGHRRRPLVLSSDRGRGKSSALGIAAARLMDQANRRILVTAPRRSAADTLFQQARRLLPCVKLKQGDLYFGNSSLTYSAPDHLLLDPSPADLLLVDEAAAIPTALLEGLLVRYPRVVFATTVHGYEGTGRGFALRFRAHLERETPQWREITLQTPIRWAEDDPLEPLLFRLLGLDANPAADAMVAAADHCGETLMAESAWLLQHEQALQQLFGLLVLAHYRTTPLDLRLLLDAPNLQTLLLRHGESIVGAALLSAEGGFDVAVCREIWAGQRRPRGHLLAQSLGAHVGVLTAPSLKGVRIVRIAIHPAAQRRGLGTYLLKRTREWAMQQGYDYLGTSFGVSEELFGFWHLNGLQPVRLGLRTGSCSGDHSLLMIAPISHQGKEMAGQASKRFARQLPALLSDPLRHLSPSLAARLLSASDITAVSALSEDDWSDLSGFAFHRRGYDTSLPAIEQLTLMGLGSDDLNASDRELLIMRVVQKRAWSECAKHTGLSGRSEVECRLREIMEALWLRFANARIKALHNPSNQE